ncbi:MAG TPA: efflux RND transporter periplasmic adaptor subunit [Macellibacteroides fermentans]|uniref:efflux RND transporter periplasmic adaptor subunit n=1 Tax=Macellibacteroides fermentans TaxID=879969 RepID=UPI002CD64050|nr:efflux RND transporter periplasmic adaptor subunit [Macellibacteroides fermentans]
MKTIKDIIKLKAVRYTALILGGFLLGWAFFSPNQSNQAFTHDHEHAAGEAESEIWTCSMHPQIKQDKPGKCPLCAMDLIPLRKGGGEGGEAVDPNAIQLSEEAIALANVQTTRVSRGNPVKTMRLYGKIAPDERSLQSQTAHVSGRIETLNVAFTGQAVQKGQTLATLYSPELFNAQQELLEAIRMQQPMLVTAAREKLAYWKLTPEQIAAIEKSGKPSSTVAIKANVSGVVMTKRVNTGDYVSQGGVLFDIANLSKVWALFDAYEADLPFIKKGDKISFTLQALPGRTFTGIVAFIDPMIDPTTRTARVRVETGNPGMEFKPEMYATAQLEASLRGHDNQLVIPQSAVLWTGKRSVVYVKQPNVNVPAFLLREIDLGPSLGGSYVVLAGLNEGEEVVTNGVFSIDASAQLEGKRSMMNPVEAKPVTGHEGHVMPAQNTVPQTNHSSAHMQGMSESNKTKSFTLEVKGSCGMCKERIETTAKGVAGVTEAVWNQETKVLKLQIYTNKTSLQAVSKAIAKVGHDTSLHKADKAVYDALPGCCHYRE